MPPAPSAPPLGNYLTEVSRATQEFVNFAASYLPLTIGRFGNGRHVLVVPGLMGTDTSTAPLRLLLRAAGYQPHSWRLGHNIGPTPDIMAGLQHRAEDLSARGQGPISVIGWSLGGLLARELVALNPGLIDRVITLGSPLGMTDRVQSRSSVLYELFAHRHMPEHSFDAWRIQRPLPDVPFTSIYSRGDGIVHWESCLIPERDLSENVEVRGSHTGLGTNSAVAYVVLDRLEADPDSWQRFQPPRFLAAAFPRR
jgi:pimeloyl-ACP methyl ester carboxylesterase